MDSKTIHPPIVTTFSCDHYVCSLVIFSSSLGYISALKRLETLNYSTDETVTEKNREKTAGRGEASSRLNVDADLVQQRCPSREQHLGVINGVTQSVTRDERRLQVRRTYWASNEEEGGRGAGQRGKKTSNISSVSCQ